jgi:hypothetical protein
LGLQVKIVLFVTALSLVGCASVTPREISRASVLGVAEALRVADATCALQVTAAAALGDSERKLAKKRANDCADAYDLSRSAVLSAAYAVDSWGTAKSQRDVACFIVVASEGLATIVRAAGEKIPLVVQDGITLAKMLAARCK